MNSRIPIAKRALWGIADQGLSSFSNFALSLLVVRAATPEAFGAFAIAIATYAIVLELARSLVGIPLATRYSGVTTCEWREGAAAATGAALILGAVCGCILILLGQFFNGELSTALTMLGVGLPGLFVQDGWRYAFFAQRSGRLAFLNDAIWTGLFLATIAGLGTVSTVSAASMILVWGLAASVAAAWGSVQSRLLPTPKALIRWLRLTRAVGSRFALEAMATTGTGQLAFFCIGAIVGLAGLGAVRGAYVLLGPLNILFLGIMAMGVPEVSRLAAHSPHRVMLTTALASGALLALSAIWIAILALLPDSTGVDVVGAVWHKARPLLVPMSLFMVASGLQIAAVMSLRGIGAARHSLAAALFYSPITLIFTILGATMGGVPGAAWGLAAGRTIAAALTWIALRRATVALEGVATGHPT